MLLLLFQPFQFRLQAFDAKFYSAVADKYIFHQVPAQCTGDISLVQHALGCDCCLVTAQLLYFITAYNPSQKVIHIAAGQFIFCFNLFCKAVIGCVNHFFFPQFSNIDQPKSAASMFPLHPVINVQGLLVIGRFHQKIKFLIVQIPFYRTAPALI